MSDEQPSTNLLFESPVREKSKAAKIAGVLSCAIWVLGFALAFVIPPGSSFIWVPDTLLLVGFLPLLFCWSPSWPWIVFGMFNIFIGFVLNTVPFIPDSSLPHDLHPGKQHLQEYHVPMAWILIGMLSCLYGLGRLLKNLVIWLWTGMRNKRA